MAKNSDTLIQTIIIICCFFILVAGFLVSFVLYFSKRKNKFYQEKKEMEALFAHELLKIQFETREEALNQMGEELHDHIGQLLSSTKMLLGITERALPQPPETLHIAQETLGQAIQDIRSLSRSLNREWLHQFDLIENLEIEAARINAGQITRVTLNYSSRALSPDANTQIILFRIVQEALQNIIKHAEASHVNIEIKSDTLLQIYITDNGKGFDTETAGGSGAGLLNMRRRAKLIGAGVQFRSSPQQGCQVIISLSHQNMSL
jgi:signal transduction histidine kinase